MNTDILTSVFMQGFRDGFAQPEELTAGMSYPDSELCELYDHGVNQGQHAAHVVGIVATCQACEEGWI